MGTLPAKAVVRRTSKASTCMTRPPSTLRTRLVMARIVRDNHSTLRSAFLTNAVEWTSYHYNQSDRPHRLVHHTPQPSTVSPGSKAADIRINLTVPGSAFAAPLHRGIRDPAPKRYWIVKSIAAAISTRVEPQIPFLPPTWGFYSC